MSASVPGSFDKLAEIELSLMTLGHHRAEAIPDRCRADRVDGGVVAGVMSAKDATVIQSSWRAFTARRAFGDLLYDREMGDIHVSSLLTAGQVQALVRLQRAFRGRRLRTPSPKSPLHSSTSMTSLAEAMDAAGVYDGPPGTLHSAPLDQTLSQEMASRLSAADLMELALVLERRASQTETELQGLLRANEALRDQCERRERMVHDLLSRVGRHYSKKRHTLPWRPEVAATTV